MMHINKLAIIGVGLIGGSLARALRHHRVCDQIMGYGRNRERLKKAVELAVIDDFSTQLERVVKDADVVVLATPLSTTDALLAAMRPLLKADVILTDVGSAKSRVIASAREILGDLLPRFVPGHPIAGTEKSGVEASFATLFEDHRVILTPLPETAVDALQLITEMWETVGAEVGYLSAEHHDEVLAATSHLPHLLAYALVDCLAGLRDRDEIFQFAAGGFADFTRIASSSPEMWHDICLANREQLLAVFERFNDQLQNTRYALEQNDSEALLEQFTRAKQARDRFNDKRKTPGRDNH